MDNDQPLYLSPLAILIMAIALPIVLRRDLMDDRNIGYQVMADIMLTPARLWTPPADYEDMVEEFQWTRVEQLVRYEYDLHDVEERPDWLPL